MTDHQKKLVAAVRLHAQENYHDGWQVVVDRWYDTDIAAAILGKDSKMTIKSAITKVADVVRVHNAMRI